MSELFHPDANGIVDFQVRQEDVKPEPQPGRPVLYFLITPPSGSQSLQFGGAGLGQQCEV